ncbi:MAG: hypothetical protein IT336_00145, partial [Thermomicrobiales bacterium]|nr:hypothetical protein [Thermomicrobiales bacterium]
MGGFGRRLLVAMVLLCLIAPVFATNGRTAGAARQRNVDAAPPVDVTAIALRPNELARDGFMMRGGSRLSPQDLAVQTGVSVDEVMESGLGRSYSLAISLAPDGRSDCMGQVIVSWVYELADEDAARDMLDESILISTDD